MFSSHSSFIIAAVHCITLRTTAPLTTLGGKNVNPIKHLSLFAMLISHHAMSISSFKAARETL